jgi:hypothetical protein
MQKKKFTVLVGLGFFIFGMSNWGEVEDAFFC